MTGEATLPARISCAVISKIAPVQLFVEMFGAQEIRDAVEGVVVDENRAQQRLFGLDIVRGETVRCLFGRVRKLHEPAAEVFDG